MPDPIAHDPGSSEKSARRSFLRVGALTLGGISLPQILRLRKVAAGPSSQSPKSVILLWMTGGPSHIDMVDLKPQATAEVRGPFSPIETTLPGFQVCDLMPGHARVAKHLAVIRSLTHTYSVHDDAQHLVQTGYPQLNARQAGQRHPCQGAVSSYFRGSGKLGMPPYVCVPEDYRTHMGFYQSAAFLSARHNALNSGGDPSLGNYRPPDFSLPAELTLPRLEDRRGLMKSLDRWRSQVDASAQFHALDEVQREVGNLLEHGLNPAAVAGVPVAAAAVGPEVPEAAAS